ncbi:MAG: AglZ/HisF2 family acetamidino modification protein [Desulfobacterales bacterium]|nr:AglZ/HisF2 family acetamidino modification protein [Desulfobacterales bacterium]
MFRPRIIPTLLLKGKGLVKTVRFKGPRYIGDPINSVRIFNDLEADELVFVDIVASKERRCVSVDLVRQIGDEAFMPFAVGGGITNLYQMENLFKAGAEKVVINSGAVNRPGLVADAAKYFGSQSIIVSIDVKQNLFKRRKVYIRDGQEKTLIDPVAWAERVADLGAGEIMINSMDRDGTMTGYDIDLIRRVSEAVGVPVIACGGAGSLEDLWQGFVQGRAHALAAGSLFVYHGQRKAVLVNYPSKTDILKLFDNREI